MAVPATLVSASVAYLWLLSENCPVYNGIPIDREEGWMQFERGIGALTDLWLSNGTERWEG